MRIGKRAAEFLVEEKFLKDFNLFSLSIFRTDGKLESFTIAVNGEFFKMRGQLWENGKLKQSYESDDINISRLKETLTKALSGTEIEYKRICLSQAEKTIFLDLWQK